MSGSGAYQPEALEQDCYERWEALGCFAPSFTPGSPAWSLMIPPPNVTGSLHMGHAFQATLMDALTRHQRMHGANALWQPGTDHAGIATQMVVERLIEAEGKTRADFGREKFIERIWQWREQSGGQITRQLRRLGASADWANERFTMDQGLCEAVIRVFVDLYDAGLIYRGKRLVNWDPTLGTALSDLEVLSEEEEGHLWYLRYPLVPLARAGKNDPAWLIVATTRPETMLGDTAVAVHPQDSRFKKLIGREVELPLCNRRISIIADEHADPELGSGCVKITPAHDFNDYQCWLRHRDTEAMQKQPDGGLFNVFTLQVEIRKDEADLIPEKYIGLDRFAAREKIIEDLTAADLVEKTEPHKLMIPRGDRSGVVIEPLLTDQWYVDLTRDTQADGRPGGRKALVAPAIQAVKKGDIRFLPEHWQKTYFQWLEGIEDWCISRQIWWGHRIPAWYDADGNIYVGLNETDARKKNNIASEVALHQDDDVLDTWFSSALWPFSTLGWPEKTERLETFYPTSVLVTGFDIIFFWVARMIMFGLYCTGEAPFREVYIHGLIRDSHGRKMSKSKGNVLDPLDLIDGVSLKALLEKRTTGLMQPHLQKSILKQTEKEFPDGIPGYGADALRFAFAALAASGRDINFDIGRATGARNFCNKLWNAARFVQQQGTAPAEPAEKDVYSGWITSRLHHTIAEVEADWQRYRFDQIAQTLHDFTWHTYCDWYLELAKPHLTNPETRDATLHTLHRILDALLRLLHPITPFISEALWRRLAPDNEAATLMQAPYPKASDYPADPEAEAEIEFLMNVISGLRQVRSALQIAPNKRIRVHTGDTDTQMHNKLKTHQAALGALAGVDDLIFKPAPPDGPAATALVEGLTLQVPLTGLVDLEEERTRLTQVTAKLEAEQKQLTERLKNPNFTEKAPPEVIAEKRARLEAVGEELGRYRGLLAELGQA